ncbi:MAG: hypothetical protein WBA63_15525 [Thermomicrobiales bacterium]
MRLNALLRSSLAAIFMMASLLTILGQDAAAAQRDGLIDDNTYISLASGEEITWTDDWAYDEESSTEDVDGEVIALSSDTGSVLFSYFPAGIDSNSARDEILGAFADSADDFVQVDRGSYDNVSYSLDRATLNGGELGIFTLFVERKNDVFVSLFLSRAELFSRGMKQAQADIKVDGTGVFQGIDPAGLQDALDGSGSGSTRTTRSTRDEPTEAATERPSRKTRDQPADEPTEEPTEKPRRQPREQPTEEATERPSRTSRDKPTEEPTEKPSSRSKKTTTKGGSGDYADLGVVDDGEYQSPQYGARVLWDAPWAINESVDNPVSSDTKTGTDQIKFTRSDQEGPETFGAVSVRFFEAGASDTPESIVAYWTSDDYLNGGAGDGAEVLLQDSTRQEGGVVLLTTLDDGTEIVQYLSVVFLDRGKTAVVIEFYATPDSVEESLSLAQDGIEVGGEPILTLFDPADVADAAS